MKTKRRIKSLFIVVNPVTSRFAKTLQYRLRELVNNKIWRVSHVAEGRSHFTVTQQPWNKIEQLERFRAHGVVAPAFTTNPAAIDELGSRIVFARTLINSTNGRGIVEFNREEQSDYPTAPLYVEYVPKRAEHRFHVFGEQVIDVQEKRKKRGFDADRNTRVRNVNNGYVYCRDGINPPDGAADLAINAVKALGYNYGAVDVIYNEKRNQSYVLEVNSRPGLMGTTLDKYVNAIIDQFNLERK